MLRTLVFLFSPLVFAATQERGETGIDDFIASSQGVHSLAEEETQFLLDADGRLLNRYWGDNIHYDSLLYLSFIRNGTPYVLGGSNWLKGVDCSHFTMKIFQDIGAYYKNYMTTSALRDVVYANGYYSVSATDMKFGDMLIYGSYGEPGSRVRRWAGHVVILIDREFYHREFQGLVIGSHGDKVGVRFISYKGFPYYYRRPDIKLRNVLRVKSFSERLRRS